MFTLDNGDTETEFGSFKNTFGKSNQSKASHRKNDISSSEDDDDEAFVRDNKNR